MQMLAVSSHKLTDILNDCITKPLYKAAYVYSYAVPLTAVQELFDFIREYRSEEIYQTRMLKGTITIMYKNKSRFEVLPETFTSRGKKFHKVYVDPRVPLEKQLNEFFLWQPIPYKEK